MSEDFREPGLITRCQSTFLNQVQECRLALFQAEPGLPSSRALVWENVYAHAERTQNKNTVEKNAFKVKVVPFFRESPFREKETKQFGKKYKTPCPFVSVNNNMRPKKEAWKKCARKECEWQYHVNETCPTESLGL